MAKLKFGSLVTDARGSLGGIVFTKSRSGNGSRVKPRNTTSVSKWQSVQRSIVASAFRFYQDELTVDQRKEWDQFALNTPSTDVFGGTKVISGFHKFLHQNQYRRQGWFDFPNDPAFGGNPWIVTPPWNFFFEKDFPVPVNVSDGGLSAGRREIDIVLESPFPAVGAFAMYRLTNLLPPGVSNFNSRLRLINVWSRTQMGGTVLVDEGKFVELFGLPIVGGLYGIQMGLHDFDTGSSQWGPLHKIPAVNGP